MPQVGDGPTVCVVETASTHNEAKSVCESDNGNQQRNETRVRTVH